MYIYIRSRIEKRREIDTKRDATHGWTRKRGGGNESARLTAKSEAWGARRRAPCSRRSLQSSSLLFTGLFNKKNLKEEKRRTAVRSHGRGAEDTGQSSR